MSFWKTLHAYVIGKPQPRAKKKRKTSRGEKGKRDIPPVLVQKRLRSESSLIKSGALSRRDESVEEQQRISRLLIQKDLELTELNDRLNRQVSQLKVLQRIESETRNYASEREVLEKIGQGFVFELYFSAAFFFLGAPPLNPRKQV